MELEKEPLLSWDEMCEKKYWFMSQNKFLSQVRYMKRAILGLIDDSDIVSYVNREFVFVNPVLDIFTSIKHVGSTKFRLFDRTYLLPSDLCDTYLPANEFKSASIQSVLDSMNDHAEYQKLFIDNLVILLYIVNCRLLPYRGAIKDLSTNRRVIVQLVMAMANACVASKIGAYSAISEVMVVNFLCNDIMVSYFLEFNKQNQIVSIDPITKDAMQNTNMLHVLKLVSLLMNELIKLYTIKRRE